MLKGHIQHTACYWCFKAIPLQEFAAKAARMGLKGVEFVDIADWPVLKEHGLICPMAFTHSISEGLNRKENHEKCLASIRHTVDACADAGFPNVVCFSGNRAGLGDEEGARNCIAGLKQIAPLAEKKKVTVCLELLNSKADHKDYMCDHTAWGAGVVRAVGSDRVKLLYDIYHMQVQEGDIIATIRQYQDCIAHYHTAGVPGRHEIDDNQELNYPAIMRTIVETGYKGYVGHELIPLREPMASLEQAVKACDV